MISAFPKIFALGSPQLIELFTPFEVSPGVFVNDVEVTEKVDGSQIAFGWVEDKLQMRSKNAILDIYNPPNLFAPAVAHICTKETILKDMFSGWTFYGETLCKPKHNILKYDRVPKGHIALFGAINGNYVKADLWSVSRYLDIDCVPILYKGHVNSYDELNAFLEQESFLGGCSAEGIVIKNYNRALNWRGIWLPLICGKYVTERFKETHKKDWTKLHTNKGKLEELKLEMQSEARWEKAVQHLEEKGELTNEPKDIGKLIPELRKDLIEEECEYIKNRLWYIFKDDIIKNVVRGFPEWYKQRLMKESNF